MTPVDGQECDPAAAIRGGLPLPGSARPLIPGGPGHALRTRDLDKALIEARSRRISVRRDIPSPGVPRVTVPASPRRRRCPVRRGWPPGPPGGVLRVGSPGSEVVRGAGPSHPVRSHPTTRSGHATPGCAGLRSWRSRGAPWSGQAGSGTQAGDPTARPHLWVRRRPIRPPWKGTPPTRAGQSRLGVAAADELHRPELRVKLPVGHGNRHGDAACVCRHGVGLVATVNALRS